MDRALNTTVERRFAINRKKYFTQTDPQPMGAGSVFESSYVYAYDNPLTYTDATGLRASQSEGGILQTQNPILAFGIGNTFASGVRIPGVDWCVGSCKKADSTTKTVVDPFAAKYVDALKKYSASQLGIPGLTKLDKIYQAFESCASHSRKDRNCIQKLVSATFALGPSGTVVGSVVGGPAHAALYGLINHTTDFAVGQFQVAGEALDGGSDFAETQVVAEVTMTVRVYALGFVHVKKPPNEFFVKLGGK